eukprot:13288643-Alexandrium_andersonii.AAC.1
MTLDRGFNLWWGGCQLFGVLDVPHQQLRPRLLQAFGRCVLHAAPTVRASLRLLTLTDARFNSPPPPKAEA